MFLLKARRLLENDPLHDIVTVYKISQSSLTFLLEVSLCTTNFAACDRLMEGAYS